MAGSHIDPDSFRDALVGIVDEIRSVVRTELGTRPYTVAVVRREWSGGRVGIGTPTVTELLLEPTPMFEERSDGRRGETGQEADGITRVCVVEPATIGTGIGGEPIKIRPTSLTATMHDAQQRPSVPPRDTCEAMFAADKEYLDRLPTATEIPPARKQ